MTDLTPDALSQRQRHAANIRKRMASGGAGFDREKIRLELVPPELITAVGEVLTLDAAMYGDRNWEKGMDRGRVYGALQRHLLAWWAGEECDPETGKTHLAHASCCIAFLLAYEAGSIGQDDRPGGVPRMMDRRKSLEQGARRMNRTARSQMQDADVFWFVVFTMAGKEFVTHRMLNRWGAIAYLPLCRKWRRVNRYRREKIKIAYPAIAGCCFLGLRGGQEPWFELFRSVPPLHGVLGLGGHPVAISGDRLEQFLDGNRFRFDADNSEQFMRSNYEFRIGDQVRIAEGPFEGHIVDVRSITGDQARIWLPLFGTRKETPIALDKLEKVA